MILFQLFLLMIFSVVISSVLAYCTFRWIDPFIGSFIEWLLLKHKDKRKFSDFWKSNYDPETLSFKRIKEELGFKVKV